VSLLSLIWYTKEKCSYGQKQENEFEVINTQGSSY